MKLFRFFFSYLKDYLRFFLIYLIICMVLVIIGLCLPFLSGQLIDNLVDSKNIQLLVRYCGLFFILSIVQLLFGYAEKITYSKVYCDTVYKLNEAILNHLDKISFKYVGAQDPAYLTQRITSDSNTLCTFCLNTITGVIQNIFMVIVSSIILFNISKLITSFILLLIFIYILSYIIFKKSIYNSYKWKTEAQNKFISTLNERLTKYKFIKIHSLEDTYKTTLKSKFNNLYRAIMNESKKLYMFNSLDTIIRTIAQIGIYLIIGSEVIKGNLTIGYLTVLLNYFNKILSSTGFFYSLSKDYKSVLVHYNRLKEIFNKDKINSGNDEIESIDNIKIENLNFKHHSLNIINDFNCTFEKNNINCVIGPNGSGKSTLIDLIIGLYAEEYCGDILYNGTSISKLNMSIARKQDISITEQDPQFIKGYLLNSHITQDSEIEILSKLIRIFDLKNISNISILDNNIYIKNDNLSGGEKQKLSIIRSVLKDPKIIIFDEPTSAMDDTSIKQFITFLGEYVQERIIIIITHNPELIKLSQNTISLGQS